MNIDDPRWAQTLPIGQFLTLTAVLLVVSVAFIFLAHHQGKRLGRHEAARATAEDLDRAYGAGWDAHEAAIRRLTVAREPDAGHIDVDWAPVVHRDDTAPQPRPLPQRWS